VNETTLILLVTGAVLIATGFFWRRFPPSKINYLYGYRTVASMRNESTWKEANTYAPRLLLKIGLTLTLLGIMFILFPLPNKTGVIFAISIVVCGLVLLIWRTESRLSRLFDEEGNRR
jgi:uncharacterized membrane protein